MLWIPFWAAGVINGIGHYWGYRNYDCDDASTNIVPWGILIGGEELHNNHHAFPTSAKLSSKWYEFDIGWLYIRILQALGLATVQEAGAEAELRASQARRSTSTPCRPCIANRYDVLSRYAKSIEAHLRHEIERCGTGRRAMRKCCARSSAPCCAARRWPAMRAPSWPRR